MTNDGDFAAGLAHPRRRTPKVYVAKVHGGVKDEDLERWSESIAVDGRPTQPALVKRLRFAEGNTWLEIRLTEGRNRQVRRLGEAAGFPVMRLARVEFAGITAEGLRPGEWRSLSGDELATMKKAFGVPRKVRSAPTAVPDGSARRTPRGRARPAKERARKATGAAAKEPGARPRRRAASPSAGRSKKRTKRAR
jgi:23S rRNA pseudouridine2605 synthase